MRVVVDKGICTGCGICADICPEVFGISGSVVVIMADPVLDGCEQSCQAASESCPVEAICMVDGY